MSYGRINGMQQIKIILEKILTILKFLRFTYKNLNSMVTLQELWGGSIEDS